MANYREGDTPVPGYHLVRFLGAGGFGQVWQATAPGGARVALKIIALDGKQGLKEFRAVRLVKNVRHPNLVSINGFWLKDETGKTLDGDAGADADSFALLNARASELIVAMGLGEKNLQDRLQECVREGKPGIPAEELLGYLEESAKALDFLNSPKHDMGDGKPNSSIQHCDIKPQNILIVGGSAQVCDFGLARQMGASRTTSSPSVSIAYTAPELLDNQTNPATDQYSLAITYIELRTGKLPFGTDNPAAMIYAHLHGKLRLDDLNEAERAVIRKASSVDPKQRFGSCTEMVRALRDAVFPPHPTHPPSRPGTGPVDIHGRLELQKGTELVPGYRLERHLGTGSYGQVWEAVGPGSMRLAMKVIGELDEAASQQEFRALELIKAVEHKYLIEIVAYWLLDSQGQVIPDEARGKPGAATPATLVIGTRLARSHLGQRLKDCLADGQPGIPAGELIRYMDQAARALDYLNGPNHVIDGKTVSIQHRDIKPENVLLTTAGDVKIADFGLAKVVEGLSSVVHTRSMGLTPYYAAPEVFEGKVSRWSDQYSLAITYCQLRTGALPFGRMASVKDIMQAHLLGRLDLSRLAPDERAVIARATALQPEARFETCQEMVQALLEACRDDLGEANIEQSMFPSMISPFHRKSDASGRVSPGQIGLPPRSGPVAPVAQKPPPVTGGEETLIPPDPPTGGRRPGQAAPPTGGRAPVPAPGRPSPSTGHQKPAQRAPVTGHANPPPGANAKGRPSSKQLPQVDFPRPTGAAAKPPVVPAPVPRPADPGSAWANRSTMIILVVIVVGLIGAFAIGVWFAAMWRDMGKTKARGAIEQHLQDGQFAKAREALADDTLEDEDRAELGPKIAAAEQAAVAAARKRRVDEVKGVAHQAMAQQDFPAALQAIDDALRASGAARLEPAEVHDLVEDLKSRWLVAALTRADKLEEDPTPGGVERALAFLGDLPRRFPDTPRVKELQAHLQELKDTLADPARAVAGGEAALKEGNLDRAGKRFENAIKLVRDGTATGAGTQARAYLGRARVKARSKQPEWQAIRRDLDAAQPGANDLPRDLKPSFYALTLLAAAALQADDARAVLEARDQLRLSAAAVTDPWEAAQVEQVTAAAVARAQARLAELPPTDALPLARLIRLFGPREFPPEVQERFDVLEALGTNDAAQLAKYLDAPRNPWRAQVLQAYLRLAGTQNDEAKLQDMLRRLDAALARLPEGERQGHQEAVAALRRDTANKAINGLIARADRLVEARNFAELGKLLDEVRRQDPENTAKREQRQALEALVLAHGPAASQAKAGPLLTALLPLAADRGFPPYLAPLGLAYAQLADRGLVPLKDAWPRLDLARRHVPAKQAQDLEPQVAKLGQTFAGLLVTEARQLLAKDQAKEALAALKLAERADPQAFGGADAREVRVLALAAAPDPAFNREEVLQQAEALFGEARAGKRKGKDQLARAFARLALASGQERWVKAAGERLKDDRALLGDDLRPQLADAFTRALAEEADGLRRKQDWARALSTLDQIHPYQPTAKVQAAADAVRALVLMARPGDPAAGVDLAVRLLKEQPDVAHGVDLGDGLATLAAKEARFQDEATEQALKSLLAVLPAGPDKDRLTPAYARLEKPLGLARSLAARWKDLDRATPWADLVAECGQAALTDMVRVCLVEGLIEQHRGGAVPAPDLERARNALKALRDREAPAARYVRGLERFVTEDAAGALEAVAPLLPGLKPVEWRDHRRARLAAILERSAEGLRNRTADALFVPFQADPANAAELALARLKQARGLAPAGEAPAWLNRPRLDLNLALAAWHAPKGKDPVLAAEAAAGLGAAQLTGPDRVLCLEVQTLTARDAGTRLARLRSLAEAVAVQAPAKQARRAYVRFLEPGLKAAGGAAATGEQQQALAAIYATAGRLALKEPKAGWEDLTALVPAGGGPKAPTPAVAALQAAATLARQAGDEAGLARYLMSLAQARYDTPRNPQDPPARLQEWRGRIRKECQEAATLAEKHRLPQEQAEALNLATLVRHHEARQEPELAKRRGLLTEVVEGYGKAVAVPGVAEGWRVVPLCSQSEACRDLVWVLRGLREEIEALRPWVDRAQSHADEAVRLLEQHPQHTSLASLASPYLAQGLALEMRADVLGEPGQIELAAARYEACRQRYQKAGQAPPADLWVAIGVNRLTLLRKDWGAAALANEARGALDKALDADPSVTMAVVAHRNLMELDLMAADQPAGADQHCRAVVRLLKDGGEEATTRATLEDRLRWGLAAAQKASPGRAAAAAAHLRAALAFAEELSRLDAMAAERWRKEYRKVAFLAGYGLADQAKAAEVADWAGVLELGGPDGVAEAAFLRGLAHRKAGQYAEAVQVLQRGLPQGKIASEAQLRVKMAMLDLYLMQGNGGQFLVADRPPWSTIFRDADAAVQAAKDANLPLDNRPRFQIDALRVAGLLRFWGLRLNRAQLAEADQENARAVAQLREAIRLADGVLDLDKDRDKLWDMHYYLVMNLVLYLQTGTAREASKAAEWSKLRQVALDSLDQAEKLRPGFQKADIDAVRTGLKGLAAP